MPSQFYGKVTRLIPPLNIGGTDYGAAVQFNTNPQKPGTAPVIVSGTFAKTPSGTTTKTVTASRAFQQDSYSIVLGAGNSWEQVFDVLMGGNICQTTEPQRLYSWANGRSFRGGDALDRAQPGDVLYWNGKGFLITAAEAFAAAPDSVTWQTGEKTATVSYHNVSVNDVELEAPDVSGANAGAAIYMPADDTGPYHEAGLFVWDGAAYVAIHRKIFDRPSVGEGSDGEPDEYWYPPDASFHATEPEAWVEPGTFAVRLSKATGLTGDKVAALYYHAGLLTATNAATYYVLTASGGTGYASTADSLAAIMAPTREDFAAPFFVAKGGTSLTYGRGALEWRVGSGAGAPFVAILWDGGDIVGVKKRETAGGSVSDVTFTANASTFTGAVFQLRLTKTGADIKLEHSPDGVTWTEAATVTLPDVEENTGGNLSVTAWEAGKAVKVRGWFTGSPLVFRALGAGGTMDEERLQVWEDLLFSVDVAKPSGGAITKVELERRGPDGSIGYTDMTLSVTATRDHYGVVGPYLRWYSETSGDRVRITQASPGGSHSGVGRPPRMGGTVNMATMSEVDGVGTSSTSENHANWRDRLTVLDPHEELAALAGEAFEIRRDPVFSPDNPPEIRFDVKDETGEGSATWADPAVEGTDFIARWPEGILLIPSSFLAGLSAGAELCVRAKGAGFSQAGNMEARQFNDLAEAVEALSNGFVPVASTSAGIGVTGVGDALAEFPSGFTCVDCTTVDHTGMMIGGKTRGAWGSLNDALASIGATWPFWGDVGLWRTYAFGNPESLTSANTDVSHDCGDGTSCPGGFTSWNEENEGHAATELFLYPYQGPGGGEPNYFGEEFVVEELGDVSLTGGKFSFGGIAVNFLPVIRNLPAGSVCLEAYMPVRFTGIVSTRYHGSETTEFDAGGAVTDGTWEIYVNGSLYQRRVMVDSEVTEETDNSAGFELHENSAGISFMLMGKRRSSRNITVYRVPAPVPPEEHPIPDGDWRTFGGFTAVGASAADGKWVLVDVTNIVNAMLATARTSKYVDFQLWPGRAAVDPDAGVGSLAHYLRSCYASQSISCTITGGGAEPRHHRHEFTYAGQFTQWDSMETGPIIGRFRLASTGADDAVAPKIWPPAIPAE